MIFRYFIPGATEATPELIRQLELERTFRDCLDSLVVTQIQGGPDKGAGGLVITAPQISESLSSRTGYYPADHESGKDTWTQVEIVGSETGYWIGFETEKPPIARTLRRAVTLDGYDRKLGDGGEWACPVVQQFTETRLPQKFVMMGAAAPLQTVTDERYRSVDTVGQKLATMQILSDECWDELEPWIGQGLDVQTQVTLSVELLSANYRVGFVECSVLGLLTTETVGQILNCAIDEPWRLEAMEDAKKKGDLLQLRIVLVGLLTGPEQDQEVDTDPPTQTTSFSDADLETSSKSSSTSTPELLAEAGV